jgi:hypothetical protein
VGQTNNDDCNKDINKDSRDGKDKKSDGDGNNKKSVEDNVHSGACSGYDWGNNNHGRRQ